MIQKDLQGNLWECKIGTRSSGKTFQAIKYVNQKVENSNCEIAIINSNGDLITNDILQCDDTVKGYVDIVSNLKGSNKE